MRYRVSGGNPPLVLLFEDKIDYPDSFVARHGKRKIYGIDVSKLNRLSQEEKAVRIIEILAYGFNDYYVRESVCGRGIFGVQGTGEFC